MIFRLSRLVGICFQVPYPSLPCWDVPRNPESMVIKWLISATFTDLLLASWDIHVEPLPSFVAQVLWQAVWLSAWWWSRTSHKIRDSEGNVWWQINQPPPWSHFSYPRLRKLAKPLLNPFLTIGFPCTSIICWPKMKPLFLGKSGPGWRPPWGLTLVILLNGVAVGVNLVKLVQ